MGVKGEPEVMPVKSGVKVTEKTINRYAGFHKLLGDFVNPVLLSHRTPHDFQPEARTTPEGAPIVRKGKGIGGLAFLTPLVFNTFTLPQCRSVGAVYMEKRQINDLLVPAQQDYVCLHPLILFTPFPVVLEHDVQRWRISAEKITQREKAALASALKFVEDSIDDIQKVKFRVELFLQPKDRA